MIACSLLCVSLLLSLVRRCLDELTPFLCPLNDFPFRNQFGVRLCRQRTLQAREANIDLRPFKVCERLIAPHMLYAQRTYV